MKQFFHAFGSSSAPRLVVIALIALCSAAQLVAQEEKKEDPYANLPKKGSLAGSLDSGYGNTSIEGPWGGTSTEGENGSPIQGSVSKLDERTWMMKVFNNSEDKFRVTLQVAQYSVDNKKLKTNTYSYTLAGKGSVDRRISTHPSTAHCVLNLTNWKHLSKPMNVEEIKKQIEEKKKELAELEAQLGGSAPAKK